MKKGLNLTNHFPSFANFFSSCFALFFKFIFSFFHVVFSFFQVVFFVFPSCFFGFFNLGPKPTRKNARTNLKKEVRQLEGLAGGTCSRRRNLGPGFSSSFGPEFKFCRRTDFLFFSADELLLCGRTAQRATDFRKHSKKSKLGSIPSCLLHRIPWV